MIKLLLLCIATVLLSQDDFNDDFLQSLDEASEVATKTKLNIDDTPLFVTVLHSKKLQELGVSNVFEALGLVSGVQLKKEGSGILSAVFRGATQKGEVVFMVDGIAINNNYRGSIYYYLDFPIELIKRIEVIRGAGYSNYGAGAISGVINIITNIAGDNQKSNVFASGGTHDTLKGGAFVSGKLGDVKLGLDAYYQKNDAFIDGTNRHLKDYSAGINIKDEHLSFIARIKKSDIGNAYGILASPDLDKNNYNNINSSTIAQLSYENQLDKNNKFSLKAGYKNYAQDAYIKYSSATNITAQYEEKGFYGEIKITSNSIKNNKLSIGLKLEDSEAVKSNWSALKPYISDPKFTRDIFSFYINDKYHYSSKIDITAGLRYDDISDVGDAVAPTVGIIYRLDERIKLKTVYSNAFRAPSWIELTNNLNLKMEKSVNFDMGIVFLQNQQNRFQLNAYATEIENMINKVGRNYTQSGEIEIYGVESEYIYSPNSKLELGLYASYIKTQDDLDNYRELADIADILASTTLSYEIGKGFSIGSLLKYVSSSSRAKGDLRDDLDENIIYDQTISYTNKDFSTSLVVKNLFDSKNRYPLPQKYTKDFDDRQRTIMLNASLEF